MKIAPLDESNFLIFSAQHYTNPNCIDTAEFLDDLKRFKYLKKHFTKFKDTGELKERLILNHIIILFNIFEKEAVVRMLTFKLRDQLEYLKPFLMLLNLESEIIDGIGHKCETIYNNDIEPDQVILDILKDI
jgi:hypothetical protein